MSVYTISDLHLPLGVDKPMDIFGSAWTNYVERLEQNWQSIIKPEDTVILGGDFSWATYIEQTQADFEFLSRLNGRKILLKGNHDYWWTTMNKLREFMVKNDWNDVDFLHNNYFMVGDVAICGTRGWLVPMGQQSDEDLRLYNRELGRLQMSIDAAKKHNPSEIVVFLHYPPLLRDYRTNPMTGLLRENGIKRCYYGHIHKNGAQNAFGGESDGVAYTLCSCDYLGFMPILVAQ